MSCTCAKLNPCSYKEGPVSSKFWTDWSQGRLIEEEAVKFRAVDPTGLVEAPKYWDRLSTVWGITTTGTLGPLWHQDQDQQAILPCSIIIVLAIFLPNPKNLKEKVLQKNSCFLQKKVLFSERSWFIQRPTFKGLRRRVARKSKYSSECLGIKCKWYIEGANKERVFYTKPQTAYFHGEMLLCQLTHSNFFPWATQGLTQPIHLQWLLIHIGLFSPLCQFVEFQSGSFNKFRQAKLKCFLVFPLFFF